MENCLDERQKTDKYNYRFTGIFGEVFLEDGNMICGVQQTLPKNKMASSHKNLGGGLARGHTLSYGGQRFDMPLKHWRAGYKLATRHRLLAPHREVCPCYSSIGCYHYANQFY